jgi:flagellar hook-length control protein FliK
MRVAGDGTYLLNLRLEPPELGVVRVTVALHDGEVVSVRLAPVEGATHELLSDLLGDLKQDLARQQAGNVLVELAGGSQDGGSSQGAQSRQEDVPVHTVDQRKREETVGSTEPQGKSGPGPNLAIGSRRNPLGSNGRGLWVDLRL